jgi:hypothetical protein
LHRQGFINRFLCFNQFRIYRLLTCEYILYGFHYTCQRLGIGDITKLISQLIPNRAAVWGKFVDGAEQVDFAAAAQPILSEEFAN